jgi:hypothetical protein
MGICRKCAAAAVAVATGVVPMFCNHAQGHDHLPDREIHRALTEAVARQITTSGAIQGSGLSATVGSGALTATSSVAHC